DPEQLAAIRRRLLEARPDIVFVGLGFPKQERIIERFREDLPETWWLGVGVSFSFVSGQIRRAPLWMQRAGLEWVHRLAQEPLRLARRYLIDDIPFGIKLLGSSLLQRFRMPCR
ncbi:MAG: WecB/TagA/CpsF family glycosyltransferase, partial [Phycisphaeraceae bacterium]|nr:WecB/TagA/CpsF family glycosyltransferase [Phycisphaeraceae bacterium]